MPPDAEKNVFTWMIMRMSRGYNLKEVDNDARVAWPTNQWIHLMRLMPSIIPLTGGRPGTPQRLTVEDYEALVAQMTDVSHPCAIEGMGSS
jgi:hypothetical protein